MKKIIFTLLIAFHLTGCHNEKELNGTWIAAYQYDENDSLKASTTGIPFNQVITFDNGILTRKEFKNDWYESEETKKFKLKGDKLVLEDNEEQFADIINPLTKDSIVINGINSPLNRVYKRLPDSLKSKSADFHLSGRKFIRIYRERIDTIQFINDSVYVSSALKKGNSDLMWERINHNGFDILFTDGYVPFILKKKIGDEIYVSTFGNIKENYILRKIE